MEKYKIIKRLRVYMDEANGEGAWKPYIGSQLEADVANFIITEALSQPPVVGRSEQLVCYTCNCTKGTAPKGDNFCNMCDHYF